jgi:hypothetical protein
MMLTFADYFWVLLALSGAIAFGAYFFSKTRIEPIGIVRANEWSDERLRQAVIHATKGVDVSKMSGEEAEAHLEELGRHALAKEYATLHPGLKVEVTPSWPDCKCVISGNIAAIRPWVGHRLLGDEGIRPVNVEVNRQPTLKLEPKRPIKEAWADIHSPPGKAEPVAPRLKVAKAVEKSTISAAPPRAAPKKAEFKRR